MSGGAATRPAPPAAGAAAALLALGHGLKAAGYRFTTPTPATIARVNARPENTNARDLAAVFGWNRSFHRAVLPDALFALADAAGALTPVADRWRAALRCASVGDDLFFHSAFPTDAADAVFFGPDSYRFAQFIERRTAGADAASILDIGCGGGVGGVVAARGRSAPPDRIILADINPRALALARVNAALAGVAAETALSDIVAGVAGRFDLIVANPPYMIDPAHRAYRDGGGGLGAALSLRIVDHAVDRLNPGGVLLLYTGVAIVDGEDRFEHAMRRRLQDRGVRIDYAMIDPDVFGEDLELPHYRQVDRIAVVGLSVTVA